MQTPQNDQQPSGEYPPRYPQQPPLYAPQGPHHAPQPQQYYQQPPIPSQGSFAPPQAPKKPRRWPWILACFVCLMIGYGAGASGHATPSNDTTTQMAPIATTIVTHATTVPIKPTPTQKPKTWTITQTLNGNGTKKTDSFTVDNTWKLQWSCDPTQNALGQYNVIIAVTGNDGTPIDPAAVNTICKPGNTSGETTERQGGNIFLDVTSEDAWTVKVLELR